MNKAVVSLHNKKQTQMDLKDKMQLAMITPEMEKQLLAVIKKLEALDNTDETNADHESWNQIDAVTTAIHLLKIAPRSYKDHTEKDRYYNCECYKCGWFGSSELLCGGGQIADTGDYGDCFCPVCESVNIEEREAAIACAEIANKEIESAYKKEAIGFAEWCLKECETIQIDGSIIWVSRISRIIRNTEQLYSIYKEVKNESDNN